MESSNHISINNTNEFYDNNYDQYNLLLIKLPTTTIIIDNNNINSYSSSSTTSSHQLISTNSFEFNAATTSLSEDSGLPHTNSSISSGDSSRLGLCKFEFEVIFNNKYI